MIACLHPYINHKSFIIFFFFKPPCGKTGWVSEPGGHPQVDQQFGQSVGHECGWVGVGLSPYYRKPASWIRRQQQPSRSPSPGRDPSGCEIRSGSSASNQPSQAYPASDRAGVHMCCHISAPCSSCSVAFASCQRILSFAWCTAKVRRGPRSAPKISTLSSILLILVLGGRLFIILCKHRCCWCKGGRKSAKVRYLDTALLKTSSIGSHTKV